MSGSRQALTRLWSNAGRAFSLRFGTQKDTQKLAVPAPTKAGESEKELERLRQQVRRLEMLHKTQNEIIDDLRDELRARNAEELSRMFMIYTDPLK